MYLLNCLSVFYNTKKVSQGVVILFHMVVVLILELTQWLSAVSVLMFALKMGSKLGRNVGERMSYIVSRMIL